MEHSGGILFYASKLSDSRALEPVRPRGAPFTGALEPFAEPSAEDEF